MKINVLSIAKNDSFDSFYQTLIKQCKQFGVTLKFKDILTSSITKAQKKSPLEAQKSYTQAFLPHLSRYNLALHPKGVKVDSFEFAKLLENKQEICFFIGGAYGFEDAFLQHTQIISLSSLTLSHQIAKAVLCEQIYRGLSIIAKHPYHK